MTLTILMPCLNEENTILICVNKAFHYLEKYNINGEVLIADNGSTDNTLNILKKTNARVIHVKEKGYGCALRYGIKKAKGKYIIMCDSDDTYDLSYINVIVKELNKGYELVMGNRYKGGIEKGAMSLSHYIGVKGLTWFADIIHGTSLGDYHCGLRGFNRVKFNKLDLKAPGMEFASEMIIKAKKAGYKICEIPTTLSQDKRCGKSHLHTVRDGLRHVKCIIRCK